MARITFEWDERKAAEGILTVRFTFRKRVIRIIGAGYWRRGKELYEEENRLQE